MNNDEKPVNDSEEAKQQKVDEHRPPHGGSGEEDYESAEDDDEKETSDPARPKHPTSVEVEVDKSTTGEQQTAVNEKIEAPAAAVSEDSEDENIGGRRRSEGSDDESNEEREATDKREHDLTDKLSSLGDDARDSKSVDEGEDGNVQEDILEPKATDDREDRKNPAYVPRKGNFYQHDTRSSDEPEKSDDRQTKKQLAMERQNRWQHDLFDEREQTPKSRQELIHSYGYDIRNETKAPPDPRGRHYGRNQNFRKDLRYSDSYDFNRQQSGGYRRNFSGGFNAREYEKRDQRNTTFGQEPKPNGQRISNANDHVYSHVDGKFVGSGGDYATSRSYADGEHEQFVRRPNRGAGRGVMQRQAYGTVEYRRRGGGTAFSSNQRMSGERNYEASDRNQQRPQNEGHSERSLRNDHGRGGGVRHAAFPQRNEASDETKFQNRQQEQRPNHAPTASSTAVSQLARGRDEAFEGQQPTVGETREQARNQDRHVNSGAPSKRYSAIRQHAQPNATGAPTFPVAEKTTAPQNPSQQTAVGLQQGRVRPTAVPMLVQPSLDHPPVFQQQMQPYFNGSTMFQAASGQDVYSMPVHFADGSHPYVLPQPNFIGQQQYAPPAAYHPINQQVAHYAAETADAYATAGGPPTGATGPVYFDPNTQQPRTQAYATAEVARRQPKAIPIVSPEQAHYRKP